MDSKAPKVKARKNLKNFESNFNKQEPNETPVLIFENDLPDDNNLKCESNSYNATSSFFTKVPLKPRQNNESFISSPSIHSSRTSYFNENRSSNNNFNSQRIDDFVDEKPRRYVQPFQTSMISKNELDKAVNKPPITPRRNTMTMPKEEQESSSYSDSDTFFVLKEKRNQRSQNNSLTNNNKNQNRRTSLYHHQINKYNCGEGDDDDENESNDEYRKVNTTNKSKNFTHNNNANLSDSSSSDSSKKSILRGIFTFEQRSVDLELHTSFIKWKSVGGK